MVCPTCKGVGMVPYISSGAYCPAVVCSYCHGAGVIEEKSMSQDNVNHPSHYTFGKYEVIDVIEGWGLDKEFCLGNTIKYIVRAKHKGNELEDLKKAQWYLNRKIEQLEKEK